MNVYKFSLDMIESGATDACAVFTAGELSLYCEFHFDNDEISSTYNKWIVTFDVVSDIDYPQRSIVLNPNTIHYADDDMYTIAVRSDLQYIGINNLSDTTILIGVPSDE